MIFASNILDKNKGGIYCILNTINGKFYIGSTINFWSRYRQHRIALSNKYHHSIYLQRAVDKYGIENFQFYILSICVVENLLEQEQLYLKTLCPANRNIGYNVEGDVQKRTKETIDKIVSTRKKNGNSEKFQKHLDSLSLKRKGIYISQEQKDRTSQTMKGRQQSPEHRKNNDLSRQKPILAFDWLGYPIEQFPSLKQCAKSHQVTMGTLSPIVQHNVFWREKVFVYLNKV